MESYHEKLKKYDQNILLSSNSFINNTQQKVEKLRLELGSVSNQSFGDEIYNNQKHVLEICKLDFSNCGRFFHSDSNISPSTLCLIYKVTEQFSSKSYDQVTHACEHASVRFQNIKFKEEFKLHVGMLISLFFTLSFVYAQPIRCLRILTLYKFVCLFGFHKMNKFLLSDSFSLP